MDKQPEVLFYLVLALCHLAMALYCWVR